MVKFLIYAITMNVIYFLINSLYHRKDTTACSDQNESCYIVKVPKVLKSVYTILFWLGIVLVLRLFLYSEYWGTKL